MRIRKKLRIAVFCIVWLISGGHEKEIMKDHNKSYPEPAQVPLREKRKTGRV